MPGKRRHGWYWVKHPEGYWVVAHHEPYYKEPWLFGGVRMTDMCWDDIGPRAPSPDEQWQCVPKELIDWVRGAQELMRDMPGDWPLAANQADTLLSAVKDGSVKNVTKVSKQSQEEESVDGNGQANPKDA